MELVKITSEYIELSQFLKFANITMSGGEAKAMVQAGIVEVNGVLEKRRGRKLYPGDVISVENMGSWTIVKDGI